MNNPTRTIAIGDIHGCAKALQAILEAIQPTKNDLIVPLGDYIDRGPESRQAVQLLIDLKDQCQVVPLLGNHESMLLTSLENDVAEPFWLRFGGRETLESYGGSLKEISTEHLDFFYSCKRYHETDTHLFVHANYDPDVPLGEQNDEVMFWKHLSLVPPDPHSSGKTVVVGHTPQTSGEVLDLGHIICLDTYCFGHGYLSAMDVISGQIWQTDQDGAMR